MFWVVILGALIPSIALVYFIYQIDRFREPWGNMVLAFIAGLASPILTLAFSAEMNVGLTPASHPWLYALSMAALPEELGRMLLLYLICNTWKSVGEPFDCLVYGATIWAGFAATENCLYALNEIKQDNNPIILLSIRASLCTMGHTAWGVIMGAYVALAHFSDKTDKPNQETRWLMKGLLITVTLHLCYDGLLFSVSSGHQYLKMIGAFCVDAFSLILAGVFLIRMRAIQGVADSEGDQLLLQTELFKRHTPDSSTGLLELLGQMHLTGILKVLLAMSLSSLGLGLTLYSLGNLDLTLAPIGMSALLFGVIAWRMVLRVAYLTHKSTGGDLEREIKEARQKKRRAKRGLRRLTLPWRRSRDDE